MTTPPAQRLAGQVALITGAGRGIGRATALKLASEGACVVLNDLDDAPLKETAAEIQDHGGRAAIKAGSVTDLAFAKAFTSLAMNEFGSIDLIVNNAGYTLDTVIQKMTDSEWLDILDVHLTAPFRLLRAAQPHISALSKAERAAGAPKGRRVVNISSVAGLFGNAGQASYSTAKAGIIGLTQTLAKEWGRYNVTVNCVAFGLIDTRLAGDVANGDQAQIDGRSIKLGVNSDVRQRIEDTVPLGRIGTPEEAAGAIYMFLSPEASYVSGQTLLCGGGLTGI